MLMLKAWHIIAMVAWFAGLFYLPRLFIYHAAATDVLSLLRFKQMERRLYYWITWPAALLTTGFGIALLSYNWSYYQQAKWLHLKLSFVALLWVYHLFLGRYLKAFAKDNNQHSLLFYRVFNELPTLLLIVIVILVVVKPF